MPQKVTAAKFQFSQMRCTDPAEQGFLGGASAHTVWTCSDVSSAFSDSEASSASAPEPGSRAAGTNPVAHRVWHATGGTPDNQFDTDSAESEASDTQGDGPDDVRGEQKSGALENALKLHEKGKCNPCSWHRRSRGCRYGEDCYFCHLPHDPFLEKRARPRKDKRVQYRRFIDVLEAMYPGDSGRMSEVAQELSRDDYLHNLVRLRAAHARANAAGRARGGADCASSDPVGCTTDRKVAPRPVEDKRASGDDVRWQPSQPAQMSSDSKRVGAGGAAVRWAAATPKRNRPLGALQLRLHSYIQSQQEHMAASRLAMPAPPRHALGRPAPIQV